MSPIGMVVSYALLAVWFIGMRLSYQYLFADVPWPDRKTEHRAHSEEYDIRFFCTVGWPIFFPLCLLFRRSRTARELS